MCHTWSGFNVHIINGDSHASTYDYPNALGNLILGYNNNPGAQTGSHNLVSNYLVGEVPGEGTIYRYKVLQEKWMYAWA